MADDGALTLGDFHRDPELELEAARRLHYTVAEVKRKTIHALRTELQKCTPIKKSSPAKSPATTTNGGDLSAALAAKRAHLLVLEQNMDFDQDDLDDWQDSIERLERQIATKSQSHLAQRWQRRQMKLRELDEAGMLDATLAEKWKRKQQALKEKLSK